MLRSGETIETINTFVKKEIPFLFIISFDREKNIVLPLNQLKANNIFCKTPHFNNSGEQTHVSKSLEFSKTPVTISEYAELFQKVLREIKKGNSFLLNLTLPTSVYSNFDLYELFLIAEAKYKLFYNGAFTCFSPESFVSVENGIIKTFPMKGTIRADVPNAQEIILKDSKEAAEHATIVDLLRNDLSMVASNVHVTRFRYAELVNTNFGAIYQISSEIQGTLPGNYKEKLGEILFALLPAGSVTGAPKAKTIEIINEVELCPRDFYTGVFGVWDTTRLESAVMIRFIRNDHGNLTYHSGGGITFQSNCESEYNEVIDKVYVPFC